MSPAAQLLVLAILSPQAFAAEPVKVLRPVPYSSDSETSDVIRKECPLGEQLAAFIDDYAKGSVRLVDGEMDRTIGRVLDIEIVEAVSMGNAFVGHQKYTKVRGALYDDGKQVAAFRARRNSMGGAFGGLKGNCSVLGRTVKAIAGDVANWLRSPVDGAALGD